MAARKPGSAGRNRSRKPKSTFILKVYREVPEAKQPKVVGAEKIRYDGPMDKTTLIAALDFTRNRLTGTIDTIEKSGQDVSKVLAWRPGPGRAHIGWQLAHCAATHDRYLNVRLKGGQPIDAAYCDAYGGGSTPSDSNIPTIPQIREKLAKNFDAFKAYINSASDEELDRKVTLPNGMVISVGEGVLMMVWHEAHHQGQVHLTWNLYKAANGVK